MQDPPSRPLHSLDVLAQCKDRVTEHFRRIFRRESLPESVREKDPTSRSDEPGCGRRVSSAPRQACAAPTQMTQSASRFHSRAEPWKNPTRASRPRSAAGCGLAHEPLHRHPHGCLTSGNCSVPSSSRRRITTSPARAYFCAFWRASSTQKCTVASTSWSHLATRSASTRTGSAARLPSLRDSPMAELRFLFAATSNGQE